MKRSIREHLKTCVSAVRTCYRAAGSIVFWNYLLSALIALLPFISAAALKEITNELAALVTLGRPMTVSYTHLMEKYGGENKKAYGRPAAVGPFVGRRGRYA